MRDHIGAELSETLAAYQAALAQALAARGFTDVSVVDAEVLTQAAETPSIAAIARARGVTKQAIQGQMQGLLRRGYVTLRPNPEDARTKRIELTGAGAGVVSAFAEACADLHGAVETRLGVERLKNMRNMLGQTRAAVG